MVCYPYAKINIGLYVVSKRPDGYHNLETVFYPVPLTDVLEIKPLKGSDAPFLLQTVGAPVGGSPADNLIIKVYRDLKEEFSLPALDIYLNKRIPMGAGLGGGSSDAAAMMRALNDGFSLGFTDEEMEKRIAVYGADCAFFVKSRPAFATGIGDVLTPIGDFSLKGYVLLLVKPAVSVSTREAYGGVVPASAPCDLTEAVKRPVEEWKDIIANDFEKSVFRVHPAIAAIKQTMYDMGAVYASMSGSGSTVFGLFRHSVEEAAEVFRDCFVFQSALRL